MAVNQITEITPAEATEMLKRPDVLALDVRSAEEHTGELGHIPGSILIPLPELERRAPELASHKGKTIVAYCRSGRRSMAAAGFLTRQGYTVVNLEGGMIAWRECGLPAG